MATEWLGTVSLVLLLISAILIKTNLAIQVTIMRRFGQNKGILKIKRKGSFIKSYIVDLNKNFGTVGEAKYDLKGEAVQCYQESGVPTYYFHEDECRPLVLDPDYQDRVTATDVEAIINNDRAIMRSVFWSKLVGIFENPLLKFIAGALVIGVLVSAFYAYTAVVNTETIVATLNAHIQASTAVQPTPIPTA